MKKKSGSKIDSVDAYYASLPEGKQKALGTLRKLIKSIVPEASEVISYKIPTFKYNEHALVALSASQKHCSFHLMSPNVMSQFEEELKGYSTTKATIHFTESKEIPKVIVKKIISARIQENEAGKRDRR